MLEYTYSFWLTTKHTGYITMQIYVVVEELLRLFFLDKITKLFSL
jgi:hypothetical protein